jgi:flagellar motor switch protein FliM
MNGDGTEAGPRRRVVKVYDFRRPDKFSLDQIRTVQIMHEHFARRATTTLSAGLGEVAQVRVTAVDQLNFGEFTEATADPTALVVFGMDPLKGKAILEIRPSVVFPMVERYCGGAGRTGVPGRRLTDIECSILEVFALRLLGDLREAWSELLDMRPSLSQIETNPLFAQVVPPSEMILLVTLEARIGEAVGVMNLVFPFITIEPIVGKLSAQYWYQAGASPSQETMRTLLGRLEGLEVPVELLVEGERISLRDLGSLKKGSLLRLPGDEKGEATFRMGGETLFKLRARPARKGKPKTYEIVGKAPGGRFPPVGTAQPAQPNGGGPDVAAVFRSAFGEFRSGIEASLSGMAGDVTALRRRQDEMADQLALGPRVEDTPEAAAGGRRRPFDFIRRVDPAHALTLFLQEHPQTVALILSYLEPQTAARFLGSMPPAMQPDIARRIALMGRTIPESLRVVEGTLERKLSVMDSADFVDAGGVDSVVEILNLADHSTEKRVIESLMEADPALAEDIKKRMFVFEDIVLLERGSVGALARRIDPELLLRAMKAAPEVVRSFVWDCLPAADSESLKARLEAMGRLRLSEVEAAQQRIVATIREMEESGEIVLPRPDETVG